MTQSINKALETIALRGRRLREDHWFSWSEQAQQAVHCLRLLDACDVDAPPASSAPASKPVLPPLVAVVGGASSGKSTVFNNLLQGRRVSRITARGHCTVGPIMAAHDDLRARLEHGPVAELLLPDFTRRQAPPDDDTAGALDTLTVTFHHIDELDGVLLFDTPDFTSQAAQQEGDVLLALLPWFDRLIIVLDHERWFDRQSIGSLRDASARLGQQRMVLFNRTQEGALADADAETLRRQAQRLESDGMAVLEFRRGRGFCRFAPGSLDEVSKFARAARTDRRRRLWGVVADAANDVLNQNAERVARLKELQRVLGDALEGAAPSQMQCMTALMTPQERDQLDMISRVLRLHQTRAWFAGQRRRLGAAARQVPVLGRLMSSQRMSRAEQSPVSDARRASGEAFVRRSVARCVHDVDRAVRSSAFWEEIGRWTGREPAPLRDALSDDESTRAADGLDGLEDALVRWNAKVETECHGAAPRVYGAIGAGAVGLAVVLIAVEGPLAALTLVSAKTAVAGAFGKLLTATGAGALMGKPLGRFVDVVHERLIGSAEFRGVQQAASRMRELIRDMGARRTAQALDEARQLVLAGDDALSPALEAIRRQPESAR